MYENIKLYKYGNIEINMKKKWKCEKCKTVCKESKYIYKIIYKVTSNRNVKPKKCICIYIYVYIYVYIYTNMTINKYMEMHAEKYLFEIIK